MATKKPIKSVTPPRPESYMSDELEKLTAEQKKKFLYLLNTEHDWKFGQLVEEAKK